MDWQYFENPGRFSSSTSTPKSPVRFPAWSSDVEGWTKISVLETFPASECFGNIFSEKSRLNLNRLYFSSHLISDSSEKLHRTDRLFQLLFRHLTIVLGLFQPNCRAGHSLLTLWHKIKSWFCELVNTLVVLIGTSFLVAVQNNWSLAMSTAANVNQSCGNPSRLGLADNQTASKWIYKSRLLFRTIEL